MLYASDTRRGGDCGVYALHRLADLPYHQAKIICFHNGWSASRGMHVELLLESLKEAGCEAVRRPELEGSSIQRTAFPQNEDFLVVTLTHVTPILGGSPENVNGCERHKIVEVWSILNSCATAEKGSRSF